MNTLSGSNAHLDNFNFQMNNCVFVETKKHEKGKFMHSRQDKNLLERRIHGERDREKERKRKRYILLAVVEMDDT